MPVVTDHDIRRIVTERSFDAGVRYHLKGRVQKLHAAPDGSSISALVLGRGHIVYEQSIRLQRSGDGKLRINGLCSCPVGLNCKHVAAVLLEHQEQTRYAPTLHEDTSPLIHRAFGRATPSTYHSLQNSPTGARAGPTALSHGVEVWLRDLEAARQEGSEDYPATVRKRLLYVLEGGTHSGGLVVHLRSIELRRDDTPGGTVTSHQAAQLLRSGQQPKFLRPSDRAILVCLTSTGAKGSEGFIATLQAIIATGRGRWANWDGPVLIEAPAVAGVMEWHLGVDGNQTPVLSLPGNLVTLRLTSPWYVDRNTGMMGPVETTLPPRLVRTMLTCPAIPPDLVGQVRSELGRRCPGKRGSSTGRHRSSDKVSSRPSGSGSSKGSQSSSMSPFFSSWRRPACSLLQPSGGLHYDRDQANHQDRNGDTPQRRWPAWWTQALLR